MSGSTPENNRSEKFMGFGLEAEVKIDYDKVDQFKTCGEIVRSSWNTMQSHPVHQNEM
jgi:hypothetical protein